MRGHADLSLTLLSYRNCTSYFPYSVPYDTSGKGYCIGDIQYSRQERDIVVNETLVNPQSCCYQLMLTALDVIMTTCPTFVFESTSYMGVF